MRIPSGDLAPARRRRRRPGRRGRALPLLLVVLLLGGLAAGAAWLRRDDSGHGTRGTALAPCLPRAVAPVALVRTALPAPAAVRLVVLNGTPRDGLGRTVGDALAARGFVVVSTGNAKAPVGGPAQVVFGPGGRPAATLLAAHVLGARLQPAPAAPPGSVQLVLGARFVRLRTPVEAAAVLHPAPRKTARPAAPRPAASRRC